jgi:hypothetical protein
MAQQTEFVPYEQALDLKELGFDEPCFFAFDNCSTPMRCTDLRTNEQQFYGVNYNSSTYTSQPTYSQAFRWFREKYGLQGIPEEITLDNYSYGIKCNREGCITNIIYKGYPLNFNTYEEAELACLKQLIEIVKNK